MMNTSSPSIHVPGSAYERLTFNLNPADDRGRQDEYSFATAPKATQRNWGYSGLLAFTAVLLLRPQDHVPALEPLHLAEICALIGIGPMILHRLGHRLPAFRINVETIAMIVFGGVMLATVPFSIWPGGSLDEIMNSYLKIVVVFVLMMNVLNTTERLERLMWLIVVCTGVIAGLSVWNYIRGYNLVEGGRLAGPIGGIFGNPNDLAMNMASFLPTAIVMALSGRQPAGRRLVAVVAAALMLATIVFTKSRGGALGVVAALAAIAIFGRWMRRGVGTITIVAVLVAIPFLPDAFWARMVSIVDEESDKQFTGSREARRTVMQEGIDAFLEHPLTGVGVAQFKNYNPPERKERWLETHNVLIQVASETGIFGLATFSFLIFAAAAAAITTQRRVRLALAFRRGAARHEEQDDDARALGEHTLGMSAGLIGWFVSAMFLSIAYNWTFYYLLALIVAARELARDRLPLPPKKRISVLRSAPFPERAA
jgi:putative inorganic carbon (HCO3(-)) transporter